MPALLSSRRIGRTRWNFGLRFAVHDAAFERARFVDDALEQSTDRIGPERSFARHVAHVAQHVFLTVGLIDLDVQFLLPPTYFPYAARPFVQQPHQDFVHAIDIPT